MKIKPCRYLWRETTTRLQYLSGEDGSLHYGEVVSVQNGVHVRDVPSENRAGNKTLNRNPALALSTSVDLTSISQQKSIQLWVHIHYPYTVLTLTEHHTAFFQTSPSQREPCPCGRKRWTCFRKSLQPQIHKHGKLGQSFCWAPTSLMATNPTYILDIWMISDLMLRGQLQKPCRWDPKLKLRLWLSSSKSVVDVGFFYIRGHHGATFVTEGTSICPVCM